MGKRLNITFWNKEKSFTQLASANRKAITEHNEKMLSALTLMGGLLMMLPLLAVPFSRTKTDVVPAYLLVATLFFTLFFLFRLSFMKKYGLVGLYIGFSVLFLLAIYLSVIHSPNMRATILLGAFCIMPLGFIDRPVRMNLFVAFWLAVHTSLALYLKPQYALDDTINSLCSPFTNMPQSGYFAQLFRLGIHLHPKLFIVKFRGYCHHFLLGLFLVGRGLTSMDMGSVLKFRTVR